MSKLILEHPHSGIIKQPHVSYSWAALLFPTLPALFPGNFKGFRVRSAEGASLEEAEAELRINLPQLHDGDA